MPERPTKPFMKRVLRDPLFHFLILGGLLFAAVSVWGPSEKPQNEIFISLANQQQIADLFEVTWQRKPTADELKNLIEEKIKEEVYYRKALALGLDENDTIVRRRLRQKLEFMQEDLYSLAEPSEAELRAYFEANKDNYKTDHILSFKQVLVSSKKEDVFWQVKSAIKDLYAGASPAQITKSSLLPISMNLETERSIANTFGEDFVRQISKLEMQKWDGPVYSGFGTHLVKVSLNQAAKPLTFEQAKNKVSADYAQFQREQAAENYYKNLRNQYRITVEPAK